MPLARKTSPMRIAWARPPAERLRWLAQSSSRKPGGSSTPGAAAWRIRAKWPAVRRADHTSAAATFKTKGTPANAPSVRREIGVPAVMSWGSPLDRAAQRRLVDAQDRRAVARAELHAARQALQVVSRGALRQRHAELIAELERQMQVLVGEVEGEARLELAAQRALGQALEGVGVAAGAGHDLDQLLRVEAGRDAQHQAFGRGGGIAEGEHIVHQLGYRAGAELAH